MVVSDVYPETRSTLASIMELLAGRGSASDAPAPAAAAAALLGALFGLGGVSDALAALQHHPTLLASGLPLGEQGGAGGYMGPQLVSTEAQRVMEAVAH